MTKGPVCLKKFKQELVETAIASKQFIGNEKEITDAVNGYLSTVPEFEDFYSIPLENELEKVDELLGQEDFSKTKWVLCTELFTCIKHYFMTYFFRKNFYDFERYSMS